MSSFGKTSVSLETCHVVGLARCDLDSVVRILSAFVVGVIGENKLETLAEILLIQFGLRTQPLVLAVGDV